MTQSLRAQSTREGFSELWHEPRGLICSYVVCMAHSSLGSQPDDEDTTCSATEKQVLCDENRCNESSETLIYENFYSPVVF
ncbi:hypothetical protein Q1695_003970 [Nippostrongylus brasiliensis]|nr:hypothetical protein Q1695_003970 [Nippostrongylus brasiliensis]